MAFPALERTVSSERRTFVTVVVPMYDEARLLRGNLAKLEAAVAARSGDYDVRYVLVDDGSSDDTFAIAYQFARGRQDVEVVRHDVNRGLGAALRTSRAHVRGDYVVTIDADLSYEAAYAIRLVDAAVAQGADVAVASAYMPGGKVRNVPWTRALLSREANRFLSMAVHGRLATLTCVVRAYRRETFLQLHSDSPGMVVNAELLFDAIRGGAHVVEVPAVLDWGTERRATRGSLRSIAILTWTTLRCGFRQRPALLLAIPGLVPGLLPLVVAVLYFMRLSAAQIAFWSLVTVVVQYTSLALFAGQAVTFLHRRARFDRAAHASPINTKE